MLFRLAVGGPAVGLGFGVSLTLWLRFIYNNEMTEILLTIVTAFATYLVADQLVDASGVLAVVTLGEQCFVELLHAALSSCLLIVAACIGLNKSVGCRQADSDSCRRVFHLRRLHSCRFMDDGQGSASYQPTRPSPSTRCVVSARFMAAGALGSFVRRPCEFEPLIVTDFS